MKTMSSGRNTEWKIQAAILAACIFIHLLLLVWLLQRDSRQDRGTDVILQLSFIPRGEPAENAPPPPPFPRAPTRAGRPDEVPDTALAGLPETGWPTSESGPSVTPEADAVSPQVSRADLLDAARAVIREAAESGLVAKPDRRRSGGVQLPGRAEAYTPQPIELRAPITPEVITVAIGSLFGGNYQPCADIRSKLRSLQANGGIGNEEQLAALIDQERRRCR